MSTASLTSVASVLAGEVARSRAATYRKYVELLSDPETPSDAKATAALRNAAGSLGKSPGDVEADARVLAAVRKHRARVAAARGSRAAMAAAQAAFRAYDAETVRIAEERRHGHAKLYGVYDELSLNRRRAMESARDVNRLIAQHPELLAGESAVTDGELDG